MAMDPDLYRGADRIDGRLHRNARNSGTGSLFGCQIDVEVRFRDDQQSEVIQVYTMGERGWVRVQGGRIIQDGIYHFRTAIPRPWRVRLDNGDGEVDFTAYAK